MKGTRRLAVPLGRSLVASVAILAFVAPAALAAGVSSQEPERNIFRGVVYYSYPTGDERIPINVLTDQGVVFYPNAKFEAQNAPGLTFSYERKLMNSLGVSFGISGIRYRYEATLERTDAGTFSTRVGKQTVVPITGTVLWHPLKRPVVDWYLGAGYSYVRYGDLWTEFIGSGNHTYRADHDSGFVAETGIDVVLGEPRDMLDRRRATGRLRKPRWAVNLDVRYLDTRSNNTFHDFDISPIDLALGVSARF